MNGDPFHAACPTIETMGDPFDLAGRQKGPVPRFTYTRLKSWDPDLFVINDNHLNKHTVRKRDEFSVRQTCRDLNAMHERGCRTFSIDFDFMWHRGTYDLIG